jgi:hypothetical protein
VAAHGRRIAAGDVERLRDLVDLATEIEHATATAVTGLLTAGYSWTEIAATRCHPPSCATTMGSAAVA